MIKPEQIPDAVVDALLDSSNVAKPWHHAVAAALAAWPGAHMGHQCTGCGGDLQIILPLPQEASDV